MAFVHSVLTTHPFSSGEPKHGFFRRLLDAMTLSRAQQAEREITDYLARSGGKFSDEAEREIERRFLHTPRW